MLLIKDSIQAFVRHDLEADYELLWTEISGKANPILFVEFLLPTWCVNWKIYVIHYRIMIQVNIL